MRLSTLCRGILVVGAGGYIGRHICAMLSSSGYRYTATIRKLPEQIGCALLPGETIIGGIDLAALALHPALSSFDDIILLASDSVPSTFPDSLRDEATGNLFPYASLLQKIAPGQRVIFISSGGTVYGEAPQDGSSREIDELRPTSMYGLVKVMIEQTIEYYGRRNGFQFVILRPSNPVGPPVWRRSQRDINFNQGALFNILRNVARGAPITQIGDNTYSRDYFDVRDLANCVRILLTRRELTNLTLNVGSGKGLSIPDMIDIIKKVTKAEINVERHPARSFDIRRSVLDTELVKRRLGWSSQITIEQSVNDTWLWILAGE